MEFDLESESKMLDDIRLWRHLEVADTAKQFGLIRFVDTSGMIQGNGFKTYPGVRDNKKLLELNFPSMGQHLKDEIMQMLDAITYAGKLPFLTMEDVVEIHRRVVGGAKGGRLNPFVNEQAEAYLGAYLDELNANIACLSLFPMDARIPEALFNVAGLFLAKFQSLFPFVDGNGRVGEVLVATILKEVTPFPLMLVRRGKETLHDRMLLEESTPSEISAYMVERAWKAWRFIAIGFFCPAISQLDDLSEGQGSNY